MGGKILLQVALDCPEERRALAALEAADHRQPWYNLDRLRRPQTHGGEVRAALVWDLSRTPLDMQRTAAQVPGARVTKGLGRFPMGGDPERFRRYLPPVLDDIVGKERTSRR